MSCNSNLNFDFFPNPEFEFNDNLNPSLPNYRIEFNLDLDANCSRKIRINHYFGKDQSNSSVFIKEFELKADEFNEFQKENHFLSVLVHPNIIKMNEGFIIEGFGYIIEPFAGGGTLLNLIERNQNFDESFLLSILRILLNVINYMQTQNITHNDIKAENIVFLVNNIDELFFSNEKLEESLRLIDFGSASYRDQNKKIFRTTLPPPEYKNLSYGSITFDIWSLGEMIYHIVINGYQLDCIGKNIYEQEDFLEEDEWLKYPLLKEIITDMLTFDFLHRPTAYDLLKKYFGVK